MSQDPLQNPMSSPTASGTPIPAVAAAVAAQSVDPNRETTIDATNDVTSATPPTEPGSSSTSGSSAPKFTQPIVATPDKKFFFKRMVIAGAVLFFAAFLFYDGFVRYPRHNRERAVLVAEQQAAEKAGDTTTANEKNKAIRDWGNAHTDMDILLQKILGFVLAPLGLYLLFRFLKESRGRLRLEGDVLYAPGHPPIPITSITGVANARWEKKGIAFFDYRLADGTDGRVRIDDFVFIRPPTDAIHDELIAKMPKTEEV